MDRTGILILLLLFCNFSGAQDIRFRQITSEDGISQSEVYCFLHDSRGYMWFGTLDGLNKYDGYSITTFKMDREDPHSLIHNTIYSLVEDKHGRIWIGTDNGLNIYDPFTQQMYVVPNFYSGKKLIFRTLFIEGKNLWAGTQEGLFRITIPVRSITEKHMVSLSKSADHVDLEIRGEKAIYSSIYGILEAASGKIWLGTWDGLICYDYNPDRDSHYNFHKLPDQLANIKEVTCLVEDKNENIWIGTQNSGLFRYTSGTEQVCNFRISDHSSIKSDNIKTIISDQFDNIWIGTFKDGLHRIDSEQLLSEEIRFSIYQNDFFQPGSLNSNLIRSLYVSNDGLLWIGTLGNGINIYNPYQKNFRIIRIPPQTNTGYVNNFIRSVYKDMNQNIWMGLHNDGLIKYHPDDQSFKNMGLERLFTLFHMHSYDRDYFWIATTSGAHIVSPAADRVSIVASVNFKQASDIMGSNACFNIEQSAPDIFWIASMSGIARVQVMPGFNLKTTYYDITSTPSISLNNTRVLLYDSLRHTLWAGTEGGGLNEIMLDQEHFPEKITIHQSRPGDSTGLSSNYVRSLCLDENDRLYAGTYEGLNRLEWNKDSLRYKIQVWKTQNGLPNNMIQSIETDDEGLLWMGTNGGLSRFDPFMNIFTNYQISDGLQSNEFSEHSSFKASDGELLFGGINGVNTFYPAEIRSSPLSPSVTLTGFYLFNKRVDVMQKQGNHVILETAIDMTDTLILYSRENNIRFDFSALFYADPDKIKYAYKLEGYDMDWIYTDASQRNANYTNLSFGDYLFKVKATNNDGLWNDDPTSLFIHIKTPFYLKWWAFIIYLVVFGTSILYFTRYSIIRITTKERLLLENEHNQRLHELDMLRTRFFINISHDLRTPLTLITGPVENILKNSTLNSELRHQLGLVSRSAKRLRYLVEQLLDIRKVESGKLSPCLTRVELIQFIKEESEHFDLAIKTKGLRLRIISMDPGIEACIDRDLMGKVIFNLLSNALKYTKTGEIMIHVSKATTGGVKNGIHAGDESNWVKIDITDSGEGMPQEKTKRIFERFYHDPDNPGKGYGIGLSHSKDLVEAHHGRIEVNSDVGKGTVFSIYLPVQNSFVGVSQQEESVISSFQHVDPVMPEFSQVASGRSDSEEIKSILIVEDNADLRAYLSSNLAMHYRTYEASDGKEGLSVAMEISPDLIISDIMMPGMDGIEFCKQVKTNIHTSHIPVVLLTARVDDETKFKSLETGADDYIPKPFEIEYLTLRIANLIKTREHLRNLFQKNIDLEPAAVTVTSADEVFLKKLMETIEGGIPESEFTIDTMEKELGMSHTNFYRKIKSLTGQSGKELLQNMRLKRAVQLISQQKLRISEVAYLTGFTNPKYFSKCFKEKYGVSPSEYV